ncbi:MAG: hypothetical protein ACLFQB_15470 [Chitinispirillaceae bacterium]
MVFNAKKHLYKAYLLLLFSGILFSSLCQNLRGKVVNENGTGIDGASVTVVNADLSTVTDAEGSWNISIPLSTEPMVRRKVYPVPTLEGTTLHFAVNDNSRNVEVNIYGVNGKFVHSALDRKLSPGFYKYNLLTKPLNANTYIVQMQIDDKKSHFRLPVIHTAIKSGNSLEKNNAGITRTLQKRTAVIDTVKVAKQGYESASVPISDYDDSLNITLKEMVASYHLDPPHPCYNQFHAEGCVKGDPESACGGNCTVANSCSPPEDASKADLPKTFICPRFMLFSTEMLQAARDDARLYGWDDSEEPPFNYAVVGHDPDIGGLDDGPSSCCQCYQIIYVDPEPSSPKPPELPYPKPLIVQSFNTAASGPKGFDVFMAAGGYGAFNSCYDDPDFENTTDFDEFMYDEFPYQNPGSGGISFLRHPECTGEWPPTVEAVQSSACQDKIEEMCNQALVNASEQVTEDTRRSCVEANKVGSLYHQNWEVMVKRVRCPDNLTRVTGCRLVEEHLALPHPEVQTPDDAHADGTFLEGYHTTTMQDCCKPTCAWSDWTEDYDLPVDGEWNSFYSCDKNGVPITK